MFSKNNTGVLGIEYKEVDLVTNKSDDDWMVFVKKASNGLTETGQKLFQLVVESYVYAVLGLQTQTRWPIVGRGAKSLQTQDVFHRLVKDTVTQDEPAKAVSDMRSAIKNTNVGLNMVISPGLTLVPSDLTILKEKVAGYNNGLTLATKEMKFGKNKDVNYVKPNPGETPGSTQGEQSSPLGESQEEKSSPLGETPKVRTSLLSRFDETPYLLGSAVALGFLVASYVI